MLKQLMLGTAILATSSFATYSYFPVPANHSGEAKVVGSYTMQDKWEDVGHRKPGIEPHPSVYRRQQMG